MVRKIKAQLKWQKKVRKQRQQQLNREAHQNNQNNQNNHNIESVCKDDQIIKQKSVQTQNKNSQKDNQVVGPVSKIPNDFEQKQEKEEMQQDESLSQKMGRILAKMENKEIFQRTEEQRGIKCFIHSQTEQILYISGVTGSGKTSVVINMIKNSQKQYRLINWLALNISEGSMTVKLTQIIDQAKIEILIIDECDAIRDLGLVVSVIFDRFPYLKLILVCNNSCQSKLSTKQQITFLYFLPYSQQQLKKIISKKLEEQISSIPSTILTQGFKKAMKQSGDFRELQKHIKFWVEKQIQTNRKSFGENIITQCKDENKIQEKRDNIFGNTFIQILTQTFSYNPDKYNNLLRLIIDLQSEQQKIATEPKKVRSCKCKKRNTLSNIIQYIMQEVPINQCQFQLQKWSEMDILKIDKGFCGVHQRNVDLIKLKVKKELLKKILLRTNNQFSH